MQVARRVVFFELFSLVSLDKLLIIYTGEVGLALRGLRLSPCIVKTSAKCGDCVNADTCPAGIHSERIEPVRYTLRYSGRVPDFGLLVSD
jgi:hypothetical protein